MSVYVVGRTFRVILYRDGNVFAEILRAYPSVSENKGSVPAVFADNGVNVIFRLFRAVRFAFRSRLFRMYG